MSVSIGDMSSVVSDYISRIDAVLDGSSKEGQVALANEVTYVFRGTISHIDMEPMSRVDRLMALRGKLLVFKGNGYVDPTIGAA